MTGGLNITTGIIFGISGTIGKRLNQTLLAKGYDVYGTYNHNLPKEISADKLFHLPVEKVVLLSEILSKVKPDFVIMALRGDFDKQLKLHLQVADYLKINGGRMVFCSTSNVFDAATDSPHVEADTPEAESDYGQFKIECERRLTDMLGNQLTIVRIPAIYGHDTPRVNDLLHDINNGKAIKLYTNLHSTGNSDVMLASQIEYLVKQKRPGIFHVATQDVMIHSEFTRKLVLGWGFTDVQFEELQIETANTSGKYDNSLLSKHAYPAELKITHEQLISSLVNQSS